MPQHADQTTARLEELDAKLIEIEHLFRRYVAEVIEGDLKTFCADRVRSLTSDLHRLNGEICRLGRQSRLQHRH